MSLLSSLLEFSSSKHSFFQDLIPINDSAQIPQPAPEKNSWFFDSNRSQFPQRSSSLSIRIPQLQSSNESTTSLPSSPKRPGSKSITKFNLSHLEKGQEVDQKERILHRLAHKLGMKTRKHYYAFWVVLQTMKKKGLKVYQELKEKSEKGERDSPRVQLRVQIPTASPAHSPKKQLKSMLPATIQKLNQTIQILFHKYAYIDLLTYSVKRIRQTAQSLNIVAKLDKIVERLLIRRSLFQLMEHLRQRQRYKIKIEIMCMTLGKGAIIWEKQNKNALNEAFTKIKAVPSKVPVKIQQVQQQNEKLIPSQEVLPQKPVQIQIPSSVKPIHSQEVLPQKFVEPQITSISSIPPPSEKPIFSQQLLSLKSVQLQPPSIIPIPPPPIPLKRKSSKSRNSSPSSHPLPSIPEQSYTFQSPLAHPQTKMQKSHPICLPSMKSLKIKTELDDNGLQMDLKKQNRPQRCTKLHVDKIIVTEVEDLHDQSKLFMDRSQLSLGMDLTASYALPASMFAQPFNRAQVSLMRIQRNRVNTVPSSNSYQTQQYFPQTDESSYQQSISGASQLSILTIADGQRKRNGSNLFGIDAVHFKNSLVEEREGIKCFEKPTREIKQIKEKKHSPSAFMKSKSTLQQTSDHHVYDLSSKQYFYKGIPKTNQLHMGNQSASMATSSYHSSSVNQTVRTPQPQYFQMREGEQQRKRANSFIRLGRK